MVSGYQLRRTIVHGITAIAIGGVRNIVETTALLRCIGTDTTTGTGILRSPGTPFISHVLLRLLLLLWALDPSPWCTPCVTSCTVKQADWKPKQAYRARTLFNGEE